MLRVLILIAILVSSLFLGPAGYFISSSLLRSAAAAEKIEPPDVTVGQALSLLVALRNLDGRQMPVRQGTDVVMAPWDFGSASLRLRIATNISALTPVEKAVDEARNAIVRELLQKLPPQDDGKPTTSIPQSSPEHDQFVKQMTELLDQFANVSGKLRRIKASELKLEKNEIGVTTLSALAPILDVDVQ